MKRENPTAGTSRRLLVPEDIPWRRRWPFFIEWNDPDEGDLPWRGRDHANGARSVSGVGVAVQTSRRQ